MPIGTNFQMPEIPQLTGMGGIRDALVANSMKPRPKRGVFDQIGDALKDPRIKAALLRSGAATLQGGLGAGIQAGAGWFDQQRIQDEANRRWQLGHSLDERRVATDEFEANSQDQYRDANVDISAFQAREGKRHNMASEGLTRRAQDVQRYGIDSDFATTVRGQDASMRNTDVGAATSRYNADRGFGASIYGSNMDYLGRIASAGQKGILGSRRVETEYPGQEASDNWGPSFLTGGTEATPDVKIVDELPITAPTDQPTPQAVAALRANPKLKEQFERKYGISADPFLGIR